MPTPAASQPPHHRVHEVAHRYGKWRSMFGRLMWITSVSGLLTGSLVACDEVGENLAKAVVMEYRQSMNFVDYNFEKAVLDAPATPSYTGLTSVVGTTDTAGIFVVFQICSIKNNAPKAVPFSFQTDKFFVYYNNNDKASVGTLNTKAYRDVPFAFGWFPSISVPQQFQAEVQTSQDQVIAANSTNTLSIAWRFAILVPISAGQNSASILTVQPTLRYDADGVVLTQKAPGPSIHSAGDVVRSKDLPIEC